MVRLQGHWEGEVRADVRAVRYAMLQSNVSGSSSYIQDTKDPTRGRC